jgi:carboxyl-terminal processing protease
VERVERGDLYDGAIQGMLDRLGDPNTSLLSREAYENFRIQTEGDYGGVGLEIDERGDYITVVGPIPGGPGARAGIRAGDVIVTVEGQSTRDWVVQQAVQVLRGDPGTDVDVEIERTGVEGPIDFTLVRERIQLHAVPFATMLEPGIGYIPLELFAETSTDEVRAAADSLRREGATSFILDLRGNPGGILDQGVGIADLFLERGSSVVETRGRDGRPTGTLRASDPDHFPEVPVVVLVDRGSASASEIVAGALQDYDRALVIGSSTFGKGSVQSLFTLSGGNVLKLTTARWYTPRGRSIERLPMVLDSLAPEAEAPADPMDPDGLEELALSIQGLYVMPPDTAGRPTVTSAGGRTLYGGGGIVPDLLVSMDSLTSEERQAVLDLFQEGGRFSSGLFDFAVSYVNGGARGPDFVVTEEDLQQFYERLRAERGVEVDLETFRRAERFVRLQLETEIAERGWGALEAFRRGVPYDAPLQRAVELLRGARSPEDLFVAGARSSTLGGLATAGASP